MTFLSSSSFCYSLYSLFFALILFSGCQSESKTETTTKEVPSMAAAEKLYAHYYLRYLADEKTMKTEASFFTEGDKQKKNPTTFNEVSLGGKAMRLDETTKTSPYYKLDQSEVAAKEKKFQFITERGTKEEDLIAIPTMESISFGKKLSRSKNGQLSWEGKPLHDKESLILLFTNERERTTSTVINGPSEKSELVIPLEKLQKIGLGKNRVYIVRKSRSLKKKKGNDGASREIRALTEFYSETMEVEVVE